MNIWPFLGLFAAVLVGESYKQKMIDKYNKEKKIPKMDSDPIVLKEPKEKIKKKKG